MPLPLGIIATGLSLLPKIPELWDGIAGIFGKEAPKAVTEAGNLAEDVIGLFEKGQVTPEQEAKLKGLFYQHEERIYELEIQDRTSARQREMAIVQATGKKDVNLYFLAWTVVVGFFVLTGLLMFVELKLNQAVLILFGALSSGVGTVLAYFFGSSKSSSDKTQLMAMKK
mgnify:CR=1 FL=1